MLSKSELRRAMMAKREALTSSEQSAFSSAICDSLERLLGSLGIVRRGEDGSPAMDENVLPSVALYASMRNEINLQPLASRLRQQGWVTAYPVVDGRELRFIRVVDSTRFRASGFGVPEPEEGEMLTSSVIRVFLVPGLAFDPAGHRTGYGGGYYDRLFANRSVRGTRIGVAYSFQVQDDVPYEDYDAPMDYVATERDVFSCRDAAGYGGSSR